MQEALSQVPQFQQYSCLSFLPSPVPDFMGTKPNETMLNSPKLSPHSQCCNIPAFFNRLETAAGLQRRKFVCLAKQDPGEAGPGRTVKQEQEEISRNHVQTFIYLSVLRFGP